MSEIELIEITNPVPEAMVRQFFCHICDKAHLQTGEIARVWVLYQDGYSAQAHIDCYNTIKELQ